MINRKKYESRIVNYLGTKAVCLIILISIHDPTTVLDNVTTVVKHSTVNKQ